MRILCVCRSGNVRSVTLARLLRKRGHAVFSVGVKGAWARDARDQIITLSMWADRIFHQADAESDLMELLPDELHEKCDVRFDVGPDDWKHPDDPHLLAEMRALVDRYHGRVNAGADGNFPPLPLGRPASVDD